MDGEIEALRYEIADLRRLVDQARDDLYALHVEYAAHHFRTQTIMRAASIEALHRSGAEAETAVISRRCRQLEATIAAHRSFLAVLESDSP